jgi:virginiamycin B lyase
VLSLLLAVWGCGPSSATRDGMSGPDFGRDVEHDRVTPGDGGGGGPDLRGDAAPSDHLDVPVAPDVADAGPFDGGALDGAPDVVDATGISDRHPATGADMVSLCDGGTDCHYGGVPIDRGAGYIAAGPGETLWVTLAGDSTGDRIGCFRPGGTLVEFPVGVQFGFGGGQLTAGPDGNIWFIGFGFVGIGRLTPDGQVTIFDVPKHDPMDISGPVALAAGPDGNVWFSAPGGDSTHFSEYIGYITPDGSVTKFPLPVPARGYYNPWGLTTGLDGNLWVVLLNTATIGRVTPAGDFTEFQTGLSAPLSTLPPNIIVGPDGNLWFTGNDHIGRITVDGQVTAFPVSASSTTYSIVIGPDGALWFLAYEADGIGRITTTGQITVFDPPPLTSHPFSLAMAAGSDGRLWFPFERETIPLLGYFQP